MPINGTFPSDRAPYQIKCLATKHVDAIRTDKSGSPFRVFVESILPDAIGIPGDELKKRLMGDFNMIVLDLYRATFGDEVIFKTKCECDYSEQRKADLRDADIRKLEPGMATSGLKFNYQGIEITWHLPTIGQQMDALDMASRMKISGKSEMESSVLIGAAIDEIKGVTETSPNEMLKKSIIWQWISEASLGFLTEIQVELEDRSIGPDMELDVECSKCGESYSEELPLMNAFFQQGRMAKARKRKQVKEIRPVRFCGRS